jgi:hypothetical protein
MVGVFAVFLVGVVLCSVAPAEARIAYDGTMLKLRSVLEDIVAALHGRNIRLNKILPARANKPVVRKLGPDPFYPYGPRPAAVSATIPSRLYRPELLWFAPAGGVVVWQGVMRTRSDSNPRPTEVDAAVWWRKH